jgi:hypothetical protein
MQSVNWKARNMIIFSTACSTRSALWYPQFDMNEHLLPASGDVFNDTQDAVEFNGITDRPDDRFGSIVIAVLIDTKSDLHE